jgi:hypothetical protein
MLGPHVVLRDDMSTLCLRARFMQPESDPPNPFPTKKEPRYLYQIVDSVIRQGHINTGEASNATPEA